MKAPVIVLGALCVILGFVIYKRGESASSEIEGLAKDRQSLSNQVMEFKTRLALSEGTANHTRSNLQFHLDRRTADLTVVSNRVVQMHLLLQSANKQLGATQEQLQERISRVAVLETENGELRRAAEQTTKTSHGSEEVDQVRRELAAREREQETLKTQLGMARVGLAELNNKLMDVEFLERQIKDATEASDIRRRLASSRSGASSDPRMKLELQSDGTVRYLPPK